MTTSTIPPGAAADVLQDAVGRPTPGRVRAGLQALRRVLLVIGESVLGIVVLVVGAASCGAIAARMFSAADLEPVGGLLGATVVAVVLAYWWSRRGAAWTRSHLRDWFGVVVTPAYSPLPVLEQDDRGYWWTGFSYHRGHGTARVARRLHWVARDPESRRDFGWWLLAPFSLLFFTGPALVLAGGGVIFLLTAGVDSRTYGALGDGPASWAVSILIGSAVALVGILLLPYGLRAHFDLACRILAPGQRSSRAQLTRRVEELTLTRADAIGSQAAELRRIERDLHDGAQARLVAIGMTLGTIEHLMETDQGAARELLAEARQSSAKALQELRDLVRGIHPPVLAERGLGDAVRALALDAPQPTEVVVSLPERPDASVEAAVYFCISELLANVAKHARARQVWVDILFRAGRLRVTVTDDGCGGAHPGRGTGLRGVERRLGTFDGTLSLSSPPGGPTTISLELPCALSSQRTSTSFDKV
ncbi:sensor histidine kinase [Kitasatospora sp. NPDC059571]|uniref:sensor histidine kinase n=1 Tax=Kitasatospora sp. NPDC059571 TaxID=3346871 RepID=UPI0036CFFA41